MSVIDLDPENSLVTASINENISFELLVPVNNLVVSIVNKTRSDGFLMAMNNLDVVSDSSNVSSTDLVLVAVDNN